MIKRLLKLVSYFLQFFYYKSIRKSDQYFQVIYKATDDLGGIYVKLIQFFSLRTEIFPEKHRALFLCFYDNVTPQNLNLIDYLYGEIGPEKLNQFEFINPLPFAAGTFGQVYKARLKDKTEVIIKVKRSNLEKNLKSDIIIIKLFSKIFNLFYYQRLIDVDQLIKEFSEITLKELDYLNEVKNAQYFYQVYKNHDVIYIPQTFVNLSTKNIIVQEYVGGVSMIDLIRMKLKNIDVNLWLKEELNTDKRYVIKYLYYDIFYQGLQLDNFYADLHPGNIKILANNRYGLVDFGIIAQAPGNKRAFYEIIKLLSADSIKDVDIESLSKEFIKLGSGYLHKCLQVYDGFSDKDKTIGNKVINKYHDIVENHKEEFRQIEAVQTENFSQVFLDMFKMGQQFNMKFSEKMFSVMRASAMIKSFTEILDPEFRCMREIFGWVTKDINGDKLVNADDIKLQNLNSEEAIESLMDWIAKIAEEDPALYNQINQTLH